jgi:hypothetical protein
MNRKIYTKVEDYSQDPRYTAHVETVVGALDGIRSTRIVYRPIDGPTGSPIPPRPAAPTLDLTKLSEAQAWADHLRAELSGE